MPENAAPSSSGRMNADWIASLLFGIIKIISLVAVLFMLGTSIFILVSLRPKHIVQIKEVVVDDSIKSFYSSSAIVERTALDTQNLIVDATTELRELSLPVAFGDDEAPDISIPETNFKLSDIVDLVRFLLPNLQTTVSVTLSQQSMPGESSDTHHCMEAALYAHVRSKGRTFVASTSVNTCTLFLPYAREGSSEDAIFNVVSDALEKTDPIIVVAYNAYHKKIPEAVRVLSDCTVSRSCSVTEIAEGDYIIGREYILANRYEEALSYAETAVELDSFLPGVHTNLGLILCKLGRCDQGLAEHEIAVRLDETSARTQYNYSINLWGAGQKAEAITHMLRAVELDPSYPAANMVLSTFLSSEGDVENAIRHLRRVYTGAPDLLSVEFVAQLLAKVHEFAKANELFMKTCVARAKYYDLINSHDYASIIEKIGSDKLKRDLKLFDSTIFESESEFFMTWADAASDAGESARSTELRSRANLCASGGCNWSNCN